MRKRIIAAAAGVVVWTPFIRADVPVYREIFPTTVGRTLSDSSLDSGWRWAVTSTGFQADPYQSVLTPDPGAGTALDNGAGGFQGNLAPVNSNPGTSEITGGYIRNTFGGAFWQSEQFFRTNEYTINRAAVDVSRVTWSQASLAGAGNSDAPDNTRVTVQVGGDWYASSQQFQAPREPYAMQFWGPESQSLDFTLATWHPLSFVEGTVMAVNTSSTVSLPEGDITGVGLWWDHMTGRGGFDAFTVWGNTIYSWNVNSDGNWSGASNWAGGVPSATDAIAKFGSIIDPARTVVVDAGETVGSIRFDSTNKYTLAQPQVGGGYIILDVSGGQATINVLSGGHEIAVPVIVNDDLTVTSAAGSGVALTDQFIAAGKNITKAGAGTAQFQTVKAASLTITGGTTIIAAGASANSPARTSNLGALSISAGASLDLTNNAAVITKSPSLLTELRQALAAGKILSSTAAAGEAIGYADNAVLGLGTFAGETVNSTHALVMFTYAGDNNLDGSVDTTDFNRLIGSFGVASGAVWTQGDFNYDGSISSIDFAQLASNFGKSLPAPLPGSLPGTLVPEPGSLGMLALWGCLLRKRKHR